MSETRSAGGGSTETSLKASAQRKSSSAVAGNVPANFDPSIRVPTPSASASSRRVTPVSIRRSLITHEARCCQEACASREASVRLRAARHSASGSWPNSAGCRMSVLGTKRGGATTLHNPRAVREAECRRGISAPSADHFGGFSSLSGPFHPRYRSVWARKRARCPRLLCESLDLALRDRSALPDDTEPLSHCLRSRSGAAMAMGSR